MAEIKLKLCTTCNEKPEASSRQDGEDGIWHLLECKCGKQTYYRRSPAVVRQIWNEGTFSETKDEAAITAKKYPSPFGVIEVT